MSFVPLICRCYDFLYIRFPFSWSFWEVPKYTLFASQKNREVRLSWVWYIILFFFSKAVVYWIPYYHLRSLLQEQRVSFFIFLVSFFGVILVSWIYIASLLTSCKSSIRVPFLVSFLVSYSPFLVSSFASSVSFP